MAFAAASSGEWVDASANTHPSLASFALLAWRASHIMSRTYALEREAQQNASSEATCLRAAPAVLFGVRIRSCENAEEGLQSVALERPMRRPDVLVKLMQSPTVDAEVETDIYDVVERARQCLHDACVLLQDSSSRGSPKRALSSGEADGGVQYSSSSGVDGNRVAENTQPCEGLCSPTNMDGTQWHTAPMYSSEEGTSVFSGDPQHRIILPRNRGTVGSLQEAKMKLQFVIGTAFSCPCEALMMAFQFVIAEALERFPRPIEACCGVLKCLAPIDLADAATSAASTDGTGRKPKMTDSFLYAVEGTPVTSSLADVLLSHSEEGTTEMKWFVCPSPAAALPSLARFLSRELPEELEALQGTGSAYVSPMSSLPTPSLCRRRGMGLLRNRMRSGDVLDKEQSSADEGASDDTPSQILWDALCRCSLVLPQSVCASRREVLYHVFTEVGEVPQYYHILSICPDLLRAHHIAYQYVFFEEGPLPICERLMVALMTASRQKCEYLVCRFGALLMRFAKKQQSSDIEAETWLLQGPPPKLKALQRFIGISTHVPWQMTEYDIREAMNAGWSVPGLIQVSTIVAETLSLCSFVMGLFVPNDAWALVAIPTPLMNSLSSCPTLGQEHSHQSGIDFTRYTGVDNIVSENRIKGSSGNVSALWSGTFNWHEHGGTLMEQYYPGAAALISTELDAFSAVVRQLNQLDCVGLTTPEYKPAYAFHSLKLYVQNIIGCMTDGYKYNSINQVLRRPAKLIAQSCTMRPETMSASQVRLWAQSSGDSATASNDVSLPTQPTVDAVEKQHQVDQGAKEQEQQLIDSLISNRAPFTLTIPGDASGRRQQPKKEILETSLHLHEERLIFLLILATMEARKEGLLSLLLYPIWVLLNNM
ncbi:hypothetical protein DQ04_12451000 [Trypanosoma grayi]|uniref:hypothetical protein n=1 Tax=Trypanosoma grayi TaxID=71804 RepID=UPI0004F49A84|nr:hypothetical protein DQ04_12451000 [Trypanosoma grayi]KEG06748.1 hypothetical protein DQ04_12451000 [Trypanosoma grayi]